MEHSGRHVQGSVGVLGFMAWSKENQETTNINSWLKIPQESGKNNWKIWCSVYNTIAFFSGKNKTGIVLLSR